MRLSVNDIDAFPRFCLVPREFYTVDSLCFFTGNSLESLLNALNSEYASYFFFNTVATLDNGGFQMRQQYVENILLPSNIEQNLYDTFGFTPEERRFIFKVVEKRKQEILNDTCVR